MSTAVLKMPTNRLPSRNGHREPEPRYRTRTPDTLSIIVGTALAERLLNACAARGERFGDFAKHVLEEAVDGLELQRGGTYPQREKA